MTTKHKKFQDRLFNFSTQMAVASIAIVGLLLVVTYQFLNLGQYTESSNWLYITHIGIYSIIFFSLSAFLGLIHSIPVLKEKYLKYFYYGMIITFVIGWLFLFYVLGILLIQTS